MDSYKAAFNQPTPAAFIQLRKLIGWDNCDVETTQKSISNSLFWVCYYDGYDLIATGRVVGDGAMYFYIQDVIVSPEFQGRGLGTKIMQHIEAYINNNAPKHGTIGLLSAKGKEVFYQKFGYSLRDGQHLGQALCKFIK